MADKFDYDKSTREHTTDAGKSDFATAAAEEQPGFFAEFWDFLRNNKKWWLTPIILVLLVVAVLAAFGSSAVAPFIYTLF